MKTRTATILSVGAILAASGAAIAINTNIFRGTTALAETTQESTPMDTESNGASSNATSTTQAPASPIDGVTANTTVFDVPNVGEVTIARNGDQLSVVSAKSQHGYQVDVERAEGAIVKVEFEGPQAHYEFRAKVVDGSIMTNISSHGFPVPGGDGSTPKASQRHHDDDDDHDDDDHDHDDDHEDDHHEEDDHDDD